MSTRRLFLPVVIDVRDRTCERDDRSSLCEWVSPVMDMFICNLLERRTLEQESGVPLRLPECLAAEQPLVEETERNAAEPEVPVLGGSITRVPVGATTAVLAPGKDAYDLLVLIEEGSADIRIFPATPEVWEPYKHMLLVAVRECNSAFRHKLLDNQLVHALCAMLASILRRMIEDDTLPLRGWRDDLRVLPVRRSGLDPTKAPVFVPYD